METGMYNNPMFASSLAKMVGSFIGDPSEIARQELAASQALLNNQTAQYRDAIGNTGLSGDLASMMIRALQAGPDYARIAPTIGDNALKFGAMGFGQPNLTPTGDVAGMIMSAMTPKSGGRGRGSGGGSSPSTPEAPTQSAMTRVDRMVRAAGFEGKDAATVSGEILNTYMKGGYQTIDQAAAAILPGTKKESVQVGTDPNDAWDGQDGFVGEIADMFTGPKPIMEEQITFPDLGAGTPQATPDSGVGQPQKLSIGDVKNGYRYIGGDPSNKASWEKV